MYLPLNQLAHLFPPRVPSSTNKTFVFVPRDFIQGMFGVYGIDPQDIFNTIPAEYQIQNNVVPSNIDPSTLSFLCKLLLAPLSFFASNLLTTVGVPDTGETLTIGRFWRLDLSLLNPGFTAVEMVLIRLDTSFASFGNFPVHLNASGTSIGYDAAVCVQRWDPWIVETSNATTSSPSVVGIVGKGSGGTSPQPSGKLKGHQIANNNRRLNVTGKDPAFRTAYNNSVGQMLKDNGRRGSYIPSPTVGPIAPPAYNVSSNSDIPCRLFLSPMALRPVDTQSSPQTCSPSPADGSLRLTPYRSLRGRDPSSHKRTEIRHWRIPLTGCRG